MMEYIIVIVICILVGASKAVSDTVSHIDIWKSSIFNKCLETGFWGPKDKTYIRKDHDNKIINYLLHNIFVFVTDIWHFGNFVNNICIIFVMLLSIYYSNCYFVLIFLIIRMISFHIFYHYILVNNEKK